MRILLINDPYIPVPPNGYGGIERVVELLALQFVKDKHDVHLLAGPNSYVEGVSVVIYGNNTYPPPKKEKLKSLIYVWKYLWNKRNAYDLIINFGRLVNILPVLNINATKISCYQREIKASNVRFFTRLPHKNLFISGCSYDLIKRSQLTATCFHIHNCVDFSKYILNDLLNDDAPLIFLGRLERIKGAHTAIQVAKRTNNKLILAGNISPLAEEIKYFENEIKPFIDGEQIIYVGQVDDVQKNYYLGKSKALLFPIEWNEPFGIVMIEAMACGTPVIGYRKGSVDEVIDEGITGFKVTRLKELEIAVKNIHTIDRSRCRHHAKSRFDVSVISSAYLEKGK